MTRSHRAVSTTLAGIVIVVIVIAAAAAIYLSSQCADRDCDGDLGFYLDCSIHVDVRVHGDIRNDINVDEYLPNLIFSHFIWDDSCS